MYRLIPYYFLWHYTLGIKDYILVARRFLKSISIIFSLSLMFRTFFEPFERLGERYHRGNISAFFETFVVNTLMRMVGMVVRFCVIIIGLTLWIFAAVFCLAGVLVWIMLPIIPVILLYSAIFNLIKAL